MNSDIVYKYVRYNLKYMASKEKNKMAAVLSKKAPWDVKNSTFVIPRAVNKSIW